MTGLDGAGGWLAGGECLQVASQPTVEDAGAAPGLRGREDEAAHVGATTPTTEQRPEYQKSSSG